MEVIGECGGIGEGGVMEGWKYSRRYWRGWIQRKENKQGTQKGVSLNEVHKVGVSLNTRVHSRGVCLTAAPLLGCQPLHLSLAVDQHILRGQT